MIQDKVVGNDNIITRVKEMMWNIIMYIGIIIGAMSIVVPLVLGIIQILSYLKNKPNVKSIVKDCNVTNKIKVSYNDGKMADLDNCISIEVKNKGQESIRVEEVRINKTVAGKLCNIENNTLTYNGRPLFYFVSKIDLAVSRKYFVYVTDEEGRCYKERVKLNII